MNEPIQPSLDSQPDNENTQKADQTPKRAPSRGRAATGAKPAEKAVATKAKAVSAAKVAGKTGPKPAAKTATRASAKTKAGAVPPAKAVAKPAGRPSAKARPAAKPAASPRKKPEKNPLPAAATEEEALAMVPSAKTAIAMDPEVAASASSGQDADFDALATRLMALQQEIRALGIPVVIALEGWDKSGKSVMLGELLEGLDPRGYKVHVLGKRTEEELRYPLMRRYWTAMPAQGHISLFLGSWYQEVSDACLREKSARKQLEEHYAQIAQMESQLVCDGTLLIKFFFNISKKEQKKRLKALESKKATRWRVTADDWDQNEHYEEMMQLYDGMMARTHFDGTLWHVLRSEDKRACKRQLYEIVIDAFEKVIAERKAGDRTWDTPTLPHVESIPPCAIPPLSTYEPDQPVSPDYKQAVDEAQKKLRKLHGELYRRQIPLILCFEGWDAAGKGGSIRRLTSALDPRGFEVVPISAPTPEEKSHHHLWRFWKSLPKNGHVTIFDRTWYGRVMVERVEGFCTKAQWQRAYEEINQFERELHAHGAILRKFWLQIDSDEQLRRFEMRRDTPDKQWKITEEDWRNRDKWPQYEQAVNDMLSRTHTDYAPWVVVEANNKKFARLKVLQTAIEAIEQALRGDE